MSLTNESSAGLTMLAANGPSFAFPLGTGFAPLPDGFEPSDEEAVAAALEACCRLDADGEVAREVVFAGLGEPLLRLESLLGAVQILSRNPRISATRLNTNGLVPAADAASVAVSLRQAGLSRVCVQLQSAVEKQHSELVQPRRGLSLADACALVRAFVKEGVPTECTAVANPLVDTDAVAKLAASLGATFKSRPYFP